MFISKNSEMVISDEGMADFFLFFNLFLFFPFKRNEAVFLCFSEHVHDLW